MDIDADAGAPQADGHRDEPFGPTTMAFVRWCAAGRLVDKVVHDADGLALSIGYGDVCRGPAPSTR